MVKYVVKVNPELHKILTVNIDRRNEEPPVTILACINFEVPADQNLAAGFCSIINARCFHLNYTTRTGEAISTDFRKLPKIDPSNCEIILEKKLRAMRPLHF